MIKIPKRHAGAVLDYLDGNVSPNQPYRVPDTERTDASRMNPYSVSVTAQIAYWRGADDLWRVTQWSRKSHVEVQCQDPRIETLIALRWCQ